LKKLLYLAMLAMVFSLVIAPAALAQSRGPSGADGSYNCEDFDFQEDAQAFFEQDTSDPDGLDGAPGEAFTGEQGVACEELPSSGTETPTETPTETTPPEDTAVSCSGFISAAGNPSQFGAQQFYDFNATPAEQAALDADGDGFACDDLETGVDNLGETDADRSATGEQYVTPTTPDTPATSTPATGTELPDTGGPALLIPASILLLGTGLLGLRILRK
jgi:hypothetical protein